jgi:N-acetylmuramoyl-L-alanine amidase
MSLLRRAPPEQLSGRTDGIAVPRSGRYWSPLRGPRFLIGGGLFLMLTALGIAGGHALAQAPNRVTVQAGDTLSSIALRHYGDAGAASQIAAANRIVNPDLVLAGTELFLPNREGSTSPVAAPNRRVTVAAGDTLSAIALRVYGSEDYTAPLAAANGISQPDLIRVGQELMLPASLAAGGGRSAAIGGTQSGALAGKHVCIDPGHGGIDSGAAFVFPDGRTLREADVVLDVSLALAARLRAQGVTVTLTRQRDLALDLSDRAYLCNSAGAHIAVSVHLNGVDNSAVNGALALHGKPADQPLATVMAGVLQSGLFGSDRADATAFGARPFEGRVLLYTKMPAVIAEPSFLTNPLEARALLTPASDPTSRRAQIARELERGIVAYLR